MNNRKALYDVLSTSDHYEYAKEKRVALEAWEQKLQLVSTDSNVLVFK